MIPEFSPRALELAERVATFLEEHVIPLELHAADEPADSAVRAVQQLAREQGLWAPQLPVDFGGQGLGFLDLFPVLEAAGESLLGPICLGCSAPDEGNGHLLLRAGTELQKRRYLAPLARGDIRSTFAMTEPAPGAGSDPRMMRTRAVRDGDEWVLDGEKWFATGAAGAAFAIVAAVTDPDVPPRDGLTLFLVDARTPGFDVVREIPALGRGTPGGHCEVTLSKCRLPDSQILGGVGHGYRLMQERLGPARLTHCMRWLGVARRALHIAVERARGREAFERLLSEHQAIQWMVADSAIELHAARLMVRDAAARIASGERARTETSMCKVWVSETVHRVVDRAIQICGALGISRELPLANFYEESRAFRIYDGPSEVHRMVVAREILGKRREAEHESAASGARPQSQS